MGPAADDIPALLASLSGRDPALSFYRGKALAGRLGKDELVARVATLAGRLHHGYGVRRGDRVAILSPNRLEIPVLVLALLRLGAVVVPLNPGSAPEDWSYILGHAGVTVVCGTAELLARVVETGPQRLVIDAEGAFAGDDATPPPPAEPLADATAVILYTSGTTGRPKGVALRQRNLLWNAWSMAENFGLRGTTQLAVLPLYHAHAFGFGLMTALQSGGHLVFTDRLEPFTWSEVIRAESVAVTSAVPSLLPQLLLARVARDQLPTLRHIMVSSAPLPRDLARQFEDKTGIPIIQGWGLSEYTNFACCMSPVETAEEHARLLFDWEVPSIGPALHGTEVRVVDEHLATLGEERRGELLIRGHSSMVGYYNDPDTTAQTLTADGWLRTGDEGFFRLHRGRPIFFVTGRLKEIIIRDAEKYSPLAIERRLIEAVPALSGRLVVLGFSHRAHGEEVGAYVELATLEPAVEAELRTALAALPVAERPKVILHGEEPVPRTHTGKIQRRKMQPWFAAFADHHGAAKILPRQ